jgi:alkyl sulfatase BDS1-like metallo-beta-lactamase superfamily hydrolase
MKKQQLGVSSITRTATAALLVCCLLACSPSNNDSQAANAEVPTSTASADTSPNPASSATKAANLATTEMLPFDEQTSFEQAQRGLIAPIPNTVIKTASGGVAWDPDRYGFIEQGDSAPDTVNPSLWRQVQLLNISGLFEITDGVYAVRNQDAANMTIIEGDEGITIVDPMMSVETSKAGLDLYFEHRGEKPVVAVIITHCHIDHYGGIRGVVAQADVDSGRTKIYAPEGFMEHAVAEGVMVGNAMSRRSSYMYGNLLPSSPTGEVGVGMATALSSGTITMMTPTDDVSEPLERHTIDGLNYQFMNAPDTEAPAEMLFFIEEKGVLNASELATHSLHNTYSPRGSKTRDPLAWSKALHKAITLWGEEANIVIMQHMWPVWGNEELNKHLTMQRDLYRYINDETLRLANHGYKAVEIAEMFELPDELSSYFSTRGYYGTINTNVKATYNLYLGWFDGNPATLNELSDVDAAKRYVDMMGGAQSALEKAQSYYDKGEYRWVAQVVNHVVYADPQNEQARHLQANALEQLGYQAESGAWRNFYLSAAKELREGVEVKPAFNSASPDTMRAMSLEQFFDFLGVRLNGPKAAGKHIKLNFDFTETKQQFNIELINGVLNQTPGQLADNADATITMERETLNQILIGGTSLDAAIEAGSVRIAGDASKLRELLSYLDTFEFWFDIVSPVPAGS